MQAIPILSLIVAAVAVVVGPSVTLYVTKRQLAAYTRQGWLKEFREETAKLLQTQLSFKALSSTFTTGDVEKEKLKTDLNDSLGLSYYKLSLLILETGRNQDGFVEAVRDFMKGNRQDADILDAASRIIRNERNLI